MGSPNGVVAAYTGIEVQRVDVAGGRGEQHDFAFTDGAAKAGGLADGDFVEGEVADLGHGRRSGSGGVQ